MAKSTITLTQLSSTTDTATFQFKTHWPSGAYNLAPTFNGFYYTLNDQTYKGDGGTNWYISTPQTSPLPPNGWNRRYRKISNGTIPTYANTFRVVAPNSTGSGATSNDAADIRLVLMNGAYLTENITYNIGRHPYSRTNSVVVTMKNLVRKTGGYNSSWCATASITLTTAEIPEPNTPGVPTLTYSGNDGYGNPTTITITASTSWNPYDWYVLTLENAITGEIIAAGNASTVSKSYALSSAYCDHEYNYRARIANGNINKSSTVLRVNVPTPTTKMWVKVGSTWSQVRAAWYRDNGTWKQAQVLWFKNGGTWQK